MELRGRTAIVTGAASGIGRALARRAAASGMRVVLADVEAAPLAEAARELEKQGAQALAVVTDVSRTADVEALAARAENAFGAVHLICNNAGVFAGGLS
jgi:NAD(P)-dependent dehydrogenase (short-subunit alcohol dehydrogenase family)